MNTTVRATIRVTIHGLAVLALAAGLFVERSAAQSARWDKTVSMEVRAPEHKPNGKTWDPEIPTMLGPIMPNLGDPAPDMMLCVVDESGANNCIHDSAKNQFGVPFSICRNQYICTFAGVKIPSSGYFGVLIVDLDELPTSQDYMLGAVLRYGPEDSSQAWKIEKAIKALEAKWNVVGGPDEFPESPVSACAKPDSCLGDARGGIPSLGTSTLEMRSCGMPIAGQLEFGPGQAPGSVGFQYQVRENECPGTMEFEWRFGDGSTEISKSPRISHHYANAGNYSATVTPRCLRNTSICTAHAESTQVSVGR